MTMMMGSQSKVQKETSLTYTWNIFNSFLTQPHSAGSRSQFLLLALIWLIYLYIVSIGSILGKRSTFSSPSLVSQCSVYHCARQFSSHSGNLKQIKKVEKIQYAQAPRVTVKAMLNRADQILGHPLRLWSRSSGYKCSLPPPTPWSSRHSNHSPPFSDSEESCQKIEWLHSCSHMMIWKADHAHIWHTSF